MLAACHPSAARARVAACRRDDQLPGSLTRGWPTAGRGGGGSGSAAALVLGLTSGMPRLLQPPVLHNAHRCCQVVDALHRGGAREHAGSKLRSWLKSVPRAMGGPLATLGGTGLAPVNVTEPHQSGASRKAYRASPERPHSAVAQCCSAGPMHRPAVAPTVSCRSPSNRLSREGPLGPAMPGARFRRLAATPTPRRLSPVRCTGVQQCMVNSGSAKTPRGAYCGAKE